MASSSSTLAPAGKTAHFAPIAIFLHWVLAILVPAMIGLGWYMLSIEENPGSPWYFALHKSVGIVIAILVLSRVAWRLGHRPHPLPATMPDWQVKASRISHWMLYGAMIAMPLCGTIGALFSKDGIAFFGLAVPRLVAPDRAVAEAFFSAHSVIAWVLVGLIAIHVVAAMKHLFINRDGVFQRMWFS